MKTKKKQLAKYLNEVHELSLIEKKKIDGGGYWKEFVNEKTGVKTIKWVNN